MLCLFTIRSYEQYSFCLKSNFSFLFAGLMPLHGLKYKLRYIDLHGNCISSIHHLVQCMVGLHFLTNLILEKDGEGNPVCHAPGMNI